MTSTRNRFQQEAGAVGWLIVMWLTVVVLVGVVLMDVGSIAFTKFRLADVASSASTQAANAYRSSHDLTEACQAAVDQIATEDPDARLAVEGCSVDVPTGVADHQGPQAGQHDPGRSVRLHEALHEGHRDRVQRPEHAVAFPA